MLRPGPPTPPNLQLRIRGAILGAVLGDAFGAPFEGALPGESLTRQVHERDGAVRPWGYTDDGEMAIGVAESLVERRGFEPEHVLETLAGRHEPARGYGSGTLRVFRAFHDNGSTTWRTARAAATPSSTWRTRSSRSRPRRDLDCAVPRDRKTRRHVTVSSRPRRFPESDQRAGGGTVLEKHAACAFIVGISVSMAWAAPCSPF